MLHALASVTCHYASLHRVIPNISSPSETDLAKSGGNDSLPENGCQQGIIFLPPQVIERNRLSEAEIRALPRFNKYSPGEPSKVFSFLEITSDN